MLEAAGVKGESRSRCSAVVFFFPPASRTQVGSRESLLNLWSWTQARGAPGQSGASEPLQQLFSKALPGSPPLSGEEPTLVCLTKSFLLRTISDIYKVNRCIMSLQVLIGWLPPLSVFTHCHNIYTSTYSQPDGEACPCIFHEG